MIILRDLYEGEEEIIYQGYQIEDAKKAIKQRAEDTCGEMFLHINVNTITMTLTIEIVCYLHTMINIARRDL